MPQTLEGNRFLDNALIGSIVETLESKLAKRRPLRFLDRIPMRNALDDEIFGRWTGNIFAADIVADSQKALIVSAGKLDLLTTSIPNIKVGAHIDQAMLNRMAAFEERQATRLEQDAMWDFWNDTVANLLIGVREAQNAMLCDMQRDVLTYDRGGLKLSGNYGTPALLKPTVSTFWVNPASTPILDIQVARNTAIDTYGKTYDRITLSRRDFTDMVNTDEFKALAAALYGFQIPAAAVNVGNRLLMEEYAGRLLNMDLEIEDGTYRKQNSDGSTVTRRYLPFGQVILSTKADDNDATVMDLANAMITEAMVAKLSGQAPEGLSAQRFGPYGYWTLETENMNPPGVVAWAVARSMPRRKQLEGTAVLTVGTSDRAGVLI
jgi:hypothetical protein